MLHLMVHSFCPSIYGQELVKAGLLLTLLGGVRKNDGSANRVPIRGDIHMLVRDRPGSDSTFVGAGTAVAAVQTCICFTPLGRPGLSRAP